jgi:hypothetical protein
VHEHKASVLLVYPLTERPAADPFVGRDDEENAANVVELAEKVLALLQ